MIVAYVSQINAQGLTVYLRVEVAKDTTLTTAECYIEADTSLAAKDEIIADACRQALLAASVDVDTDETVTLYGAGREIA